MSSSSPSILLKACSPQYLVNTSSCVISVTITSNSVISSNVLIILHFPFIFYLLIVSIYSLILSSISFTAFSTIPLISFLLILYSKKSDNSSSAYCSIIFRNSNLDDFIFSLLSFCFNLYQLFLAVLGEWSRNLLILLFHLFSPAKELPAFFVVIDPFSVYYWCVCRGYALACVFSVLRASAGFTSSFHP